MTNLVKDMIPVLIPGKSALLGTKNLNATVLLILQVENKHLAVSTQRKTQRSREPRFLLDQLFAMRERSTLEITVKPS